MAYTDADEIAGFLGVTLADDTQREIADLAAGAATTWLERRTHRKFGPQSAVRESHAVEAPILTLRYTPVVAIETVVGRFINAGSPESPLNPGTDYELLDPAKGFVSVALTWDPVVSGDWSMRYGQLLYFDYRYGAAVPDDIHYATVQLGAQLLQRSLLADLSGVLSVRLGREFMLQFQAPTDEPDEVKQVIKNYRTAVFA